MKHKRTYNIIYQREYPKPIKSKTHLPESIQIKNEKKIKNKLLKGS